MQGLVYTIDRLGQSLAETEARLAQAAQENDVLRAKVSELEAERGQSNGHGPGDQGRAKRAAVES